MRESVQEFEEYALEYDSWYLKHQSIFESEASTIEAFRLNGLGLEVGVGSGVFAKRLRVDIGIDPSPSMLFIAKSRGVEVVCALGEYLPFRDEVFDYVLMVNTLCFLEDSQATIKDVRRVLKKAGSLVLCEVPKNSRWGIVYEQKGRMGHRFYRYMELYTVMEMQYILEYARFRVVDMKGTLTSSPEEEERVEQPESKTEGKSFVCLRGIK